MHASAEHGQEHGQEGGQEGFQLLHFISFHFKQFIHIDPVDQRQYLEDDADEPSSV